MNTQQLNIKEIINQEIVRLTNLYEKDFLNCDELITLTGLGRDNVLALMRSNQFPVKRVGKRKIVSIAAYVIWKFENQHDSRQVA